MTATVTFPLVPFNVPDSVSIATTGTGKRQDGFFTTNSQYKLSELPEKTLHALCDDFKQAIFEKAGKPLTR